MIILRALMLGLSLLAGQVAMAQAVPQEVRIGVLSFRPLDQARQQWQATEDYLNAHVRGNYHFRMEPLFLNEMNVAAAERRFDFILTNPNHYIVLRARHELSAIATLMPMIDGRPVDSFGGVVFARADRNDIRDFADLRGRNVAAAAEQSFGAYVMQRWALYEQGIQIGEVGKVIFTGMPQDKVVQAVLNGDADAGFVRTGVLENMTREGRIELDQFKVLNLQKETKFPQLLSTRLYPEWAFSVLPGVPEALTRQVVLTLLRINPEDEAARKGKYYGFTPPGNYAPVEAVMLRLKTNPDLVQEFDLRDILNKYMYPLVAIALLVLLATMWLAGYLARNNRRLKQSFSAREKLDEALQIANATLENKVSERTLELQKSEARFRQMFESHASPMLLIEPVNGNLVNANLAAANFYGYSIEQMKTMRISQINTQNPEETAVERTQALREERNYFVFPHRLADGSLRTVEVHSSPVEVDGRTLLFSVVHDITERKQLEQQMHDLAFYDVLTGLPNRRLLLDRLNQALATGVRTRNHGALMFLDLDHFKMLNDLHGHDIGDQMLVKVGRRLRECIREEDSAARFGGDEFVVMLESLSVEVSEAVLQAEAVAEKIRQALARPYLLHRTGTGGESDEIIHHCSSSIGITVFRDHEDGIDQLLKWADMAMYRAKDAGRNTIRFFDPTMQAAVEKRGALEADLHEALEHAQFELFYQVQVDAARRPQGAEVLLRWNHPQRGLVSPLEFIPLAEETGLILLIGGWVLDAACAQIKAWHDVPQLSNLSLAVNVSARQFHQPDFVEFVQATVKRHGISPTSLKLELTESLVLEDVADSIAKMRALKEFGVSFSMDDFGTGYSSLSYLKNLPLDQLKIDQSFVRSIASDNADRVMVMTIVDLGMNFELDVVAEGVETEEQFALLHRYGCGNFQGYLFSRPVPVTEFESLAVTMLLQGKHNAR
ncbi:MAG: EAL domain-containing protein [Gammaproteobacteria bacterium]|nr:EAL domain-containing protein [Gammaproteobacteria bacterium]MBU1623693.1 EAL domain-containing protein [Gammaproteobacteria bacterium]